MNLPVLSWEVEGDLSFVDVNSGSQEMCVRHCFKLDRFSVEPFVHELLEWWVVEDGFRNDGESVVHVAIIPHV